MKNLKSKKHILVFLALFFSTASVYAGLDSDHFSSGFVYPLFTLTHLSAMLSVGILGFQFNGALKIGLIYESQSQARELFQLRGGLIWVLPLLFLIFELYGGSLAVHGKTLPLVDQVVALSAFLLGVTIFLVYKNTFIICLLLITLVCVSLFAIFHGYANGAQMLAVNDYVVQGVTPDPKEKISYALGFMASSVVTILLGILVARLSGGLHDKAVPVIGVIVASVGLFNLVVGGENFYFYFLNSFLFNI